ncbi:RagB/SusD family nutrient uptake outer membrane protein [Arsenicibacter rosenii]|uniref:RagB/SusD family nutrient uptake outer membrane protein n=1 Tax=Arsenicibacter rosenii TaxID=1750698 RepID=A0A1S2VPJ7_9BACT|nr:RagB/SusD family nutrient uptake outer membrane protein [Arsenicibacter rosenii]OIN59718.1 RagB/SusD family nutrient uptake outer membrane protein [Arsenicibacter rosenii]
MKNSIKIWLLAGTTLFMVTACDSRLDVKPTQTIEETNALLTEQDVQITLQGAYDGLSSVNLYGGAIQYSGEFLGDDREVVFGGTYATLDEIWRKTITPSNTVVRDIWLSAYNTINRANNVLAGLDKVGAANRASIEGQALFIRSSLYFELVRLFAKQWNDGTNTANPGVPLILTPTRDITTADYKPRNTVAEVYTQIIADLTKAEQGLSNSAGSGYATKNAAAAQLARVYLQQANYAGARDAANRVIQTGANALNTDFEKIFDDATSGSELIFKILVSEQDGANDLNTFYASSLNQGRGDVRVQSKHLALYTTGDVRGTFFNRASNNTFTSKHNDQFGDVPVIRVSEMYLIRAEANFRLGTSTGATPLADINAIRTRAGLPALTTAQLTLDAILKERHLELAFEGQQIHDVKRTAGRVGTVAYNANNLVMPIPQREIDTNKQLVQNPGY